MLGYSTSYFLGDYCAHTPFYSEKIVPLMDYVLNNSFMYNTSLSSAFFELINKYQNPQDLPIENIRELIKEQGYEYIIDLIDPSSDQIKIIVYLLVLIHMLKGSRKGLETVLSIFSLNTGTADILITEWFETITVAEENTFNIEAGLDVSMVSDTFFTAFGNFIRNYVYPELQTFKAKYNLPATMGYEIVTQVEITYISGGVV